MKKLAIALMTVVVAALPARAQIAISQLPTAAVPLQGNEVVAGVQNGQTVQIPETAFGIQGPSSAVSGHIATFNGTTGKLIQDGGLPAPCTAFGTTSGTCAQGNDSRFPTVFVNGTWTPTDNSGAGLSFSSVKTYYQRVGNYVTAYFTITYPSTADTNIASLAGLPVASGSTDFNGAIYACSGANISGVPIGFFINAGASTGFFARIDNTGTIQNSALSTLTMRCSMTYPTL